MRKRSILAAIALFGAIIAAGAVWLIRGYQPAADAGDATLVALGKQVYDQHCASCHGAKLGGQANWQQRLPNGRLPAPPHDVSGHTWHHSDKQLFEITKDGLSAIVPGYQSDMPAFRGVLSDREIWGVLAYIKRTWPPGIRDRQQRVNDSLPAALDSTGRNDAADNADNAGR